MLNTQSQRKPGSEQTRQMNSKYTLHLNSSMEYLNKKNTLIYAYRIKYSKINSGEILKSTTKKKKKRRESTTLG